MKEKDKYYRIIGLLFFVWIKLSLLAQSDSAQGKIIDEFGVQIQLNQSYRSSWFTDSAAVNNYSPNVLVMDQRQSAMVSPTLYFTLKTKQVQNFFCEFGIGFTSIGIQQKEPQVYIEKRRDKYGNVYNRSVDTVYHRNVNVFFSIPINLNYSIDFLQQAFTLGFNFMYNKDFSALHFDVSKHSNKDNPLAYGYNGYLVYDNFMYGVSLRYTLPKKWQKMYVQGHYKRTTKGYHLVSKYDYAVWYYYGIGIGYEF